MILNGKFEKVYESKEGSRDDGSTWKRVGVLFRCPGILAFEAWNDISNKILQLKQGEDVSIQFEIRSREYNGRWYTSLSIIDITIPLLENAPSNVATDAEPINDLPF